MMLCTAAPSGSGCPEADQSPPDKKGGGEQLVVTSEPGKTAVHTQRCLLEADLGEPGDGADLGVEVSAVWKLLHHDGADVMQQRLLVHGVLHLRDLFQVAQLKAFSLECKHSSTA